MRAYARLHAGRIVARGLGLWLRRSLQIHAVTALCLLPLAIIPASRNPMRDGRIFGLSGLYSAAWAASSDLGAPTGLSRNVALAYLAQFTLAVILVRDAHRRLAGRPPRSGPLAILGLALLALGSLAVFAVLDAAVVAAIEIPSALPVLLFAATTVAETFLAATFWLALPAAAVDGHGIVSALRRGRLLAHGSRFVVLGLVVTLVVLQWVAVAAFGIAFGMMEVRSEWFLAAPLLVFVTLKACVLAAAYDEACRRKEGTRADAIGDVFA